MSNFLMKILGVVNLIPNVTVDFGALMLQILYVVIPCKIFHIPFTSSPFSVSLLVLP